MAVGTIGMLDLSIVTDALRDQLTKCIATTPLFQSNGGPVADYAITPTGDPVDVVRIEDGTHLSLYLFHVVEDKFQKNALTSNPNGGYPRSQPIPLQPLALDLYYLLTAFSRAGYLREQQAMSIAMRCFHEHPIVTTTVPFGPLHPEQFSLTMEVQSVDEVSRLWQAVTTPLRLSAVYRVAVIFISPEPPPPPAPIVQQLRLLEGSGQVPFATAGGQLIGTGTTVTYRPPDSTVIKPKTASYELAPAIVAPGNNVVIYGAGLSGLNVFIEDPGGAEADITGWINPGAETPSDTRVTLAFPAAVGVPPAATPNPGIYVLRVGAGTVRSNGVPIGIAARIDGVGNPPLLNSAAGLYTVAGAGFTGHVETILGTSALTSAGAPPKPGEFQVTGGGTQIQFKAPGSLAAGTYPLRLRVQGVESPPSWWVVVP